MTVTKRDPGIDPAKYDPVIEEKVGLDYRSGVVPYLAEEVDEFEAQADRFLNGGWEDPEGFTRYRLIRGVYGQRQADVQMIRIKVPSGSLSARALEGIGQAVEQYVPLKKGHATTRENIQIHFVKLADTPKVMRILGEVGLTTREACGNTVRNVIGCPLAGVAADEPFYVTPYLAAFARWFVRHPYSQVLPRKFKVAFESCGQDCIVTEIHDLAFKPRVQLDERGRERRGFQMLVGGGTSIMPRMAYVLYDFVPVEDYLRVSEAVVRVFYRTEELRRNKMKARIKFYVDRVGVEAFRREVEEELKQPWAQKSFDPSLLVEIPEDLQENPPALLPSSDGHADPEFLRWKRSNVRPQKQPGYCLVWVTLPLGDIQADQFPVLARIARQYASGQARITTEQNLVYRWVPEGRLFDFWQALKETGLAEAGAEQITDVVSCPGTDSCKLGITSSMGLGGALRETLSEMALDDPLVTSLHVKASGCPNGCARHHIANIGFHGAASRGASGQQVPAYEMFLGGSYGNGEPARFGKRAKTKVVAKKVPELVRDIVRLYQEQRRPGEPFNDFVDRVGTEPFEGLAARYKDPGPLNRENIDTYMDWKKTVLYKVERGEGECAV